MLRAYLNHVILPMNGRLLLASLVDPIVEVSICGAIVGAIYRPAAKTARARAAAV